MDRLIQKVYFSDSIIEKKSHYHDCHQIILILSGRIQYCINNTTYEAHAGNLLLFSRYENHSINILSPEYKRYVLRLEPVANSTQSKLYALLTNRPEGFCNTIALGDKFAEFENLFQRILAEYNGQNTLFDDMYPLLIGQLLIMIYRQIPQSPAFDQTVYDIQKQLEGNCSKQYTLEYLSKQYNISVSSLSHRFKRSTGTSVMEYLLYCRIALSKNYLMQSDLNIGQIVEKCGFSDSSNFSRSFKKINGITPSEFRKKHRTE